MLLRGTLRVSGRYAVIAEGATGADAVELTRQHRPDVLVLDVSMPVMDGLEALPQVLAASPQTRVVMYTGFDPGALGQRALDLGATAVLQKSTAINRFADDLDEALRDGGVATSRPAPVEAAPVDPVDTVVEGVEVKVIDEHLERFREVFEEAAIGMATMTLTGRLVRANRALARLVGRSLDELTGLPYVDLIADNADLDAVLTAHERGQDIAALEHTIVVGRTPRRMASTVAVARDSRQRALYLFLQVQDITAQRSAEEALRTSEERFAMLVDAVQDYAIFMLDPRGVIESWNSGAQRLKGWTADEIVGQHFRVFYPPDKQAVRHPEHELEIAATDGHYEEEGWRVRKDGSMFWANVVISAVRNSAGTLVGYAKVTRDVSERREMLQRQELARNALADANQRLERANESLAEAAAQQAQFVAVTSHELRNPVSVLAGASTMLVNNWDALTPDERDEMLASITSSSARLNRLLTDLLTSSRLQSGAMELHVVPVELATLLRHVAATLARTVADADLIVNCPPDLMIDADPDRLAQAIENLALNALRHGAGPVELQASAADDGVEIRVSDAGSGVADALLPRLFERFATGRSPGGTGLGLFIVRELARAHGGDVRYEPGARPAFTITPPGRRGGAVVGDAIRVLLVDDAREMRLLIRAALRIHGAFDLVGEAADGTQAVELAGRTTPDIVVLDLGLPDLAGHEVLTRIRAVSPTSKVVVFSGADPGDRAGIADRVEGYVVKDADLGYLVQLLLDVAGTQAKRAALAGLDSPASVGRARAFVAETLAEWDAGVDPNDALIVASELVTNAIIHGRTTCELQLSITGNAVRIEARDGGGGTPDPMAPSRTGTHGRGLHIIAALTSAWGIEDIPAGGKIVWAELAR